MTPRVYGIIAMTREGPIAFTYKCATYKEVRQYAHTLFKPSQTIITRLKDETHDIREIRTS